LTPSPFSSTNISVHGEGIPNVVMEYMALQKPVIATYCPGTMEIVNDGYTGFLIEPRDPGKLADKINYLLNNVALAESMGRNGSEKLYQEFSLPVMGENLLKLYQSLAQ